MKDNVAKKLKQVPWAFAGISKVRWVADIGHTLNCISKLCIKIVQMIC